MPYTATYKLTPIEGKMNFGSTTSKSIAGEMIFTVACTERYPDKMPDYDLRMALERILGGTVFIIEPKGILIWTRTWRQETETGHFYGDSAIAFEYTEIKEAEEATA